MNGTVIRSMIAGLVLLVFLSGCGRGPGMSGKPDSQPDKATSIENRKELEEIKRSIKSDIRIKLKRDGKGSYGWEITGKDPHEVIKANNVLRSRVSDERRE